MFGLESLKEKIDITDTLVECPVRRCSQSVKRQKRSFNTSDEYRCPIHNIYISPSTFEYGCMWDNILRKDKLLEFWEDLSKVKRESRMARDNSEDAVTWNVFSFLEGNNLIGKVLGKIAGQDQLVNEVMYWSFSREQSGVWDWLQKARAEFECRPDRGSEPDVIVTTNKAVFFIEAKLTSGNRTPCPNPDVLERYKSGGESWFQEVFRSNPTTIAVAMEKYELMRFWLLGSWIAKELDLQFYLVNLVRSGTEGNIESEFGQHTMSTMARRFLRVTWEGIYREVVADRSSVKGRDEILHYFRNKAIGYASGKLRPAFDVKSQ